MRNTETKKTLKTYMAIALALAVVLTGGTALIRMNATAGADGDDHRRLHRSGQPLHGSC